MSSETSAVSRLSPFAVAIRPFVKAERSRLLRRSAWTIGIFSALLLAMFLLLVALHSPAATLFAIAAGVTARCMGQHCLLKTAATSERSAMLAEFRFDGSKLHCSWDERELGRYIAPWSLRISGAFAAGSVCFLGQRLAQREPKLLPLIIMNSHRLFAAIAAAAPLLVIATALFFLWWPGPAERWSGKVKAAIQGHADDAIVRVVAAGEIDGLQAGIEVLWQKIGIERRGEYRRAIGRHIEANTAEVVFKPQASQLVVDAIIELARQDLENLGIASARYYEVECAWKGLQTMASELRDPVRELRAQELKAEVEQLSRLAADRRWRDLENHADWMLDEFHRLHLEVQRHANSVPRVALSPGSDPYHVLGISRDTPTALIKKLRIRLAQLYHPDVSESMANSAKMAELNAAYDAVMKDREKERR